MKIPKRFYEKIEFNGNPTGTAFSILAIIAEIEKEKGNKTKITRITNPTNGMSSYMLEIIKTANKEVNKNAKQRMRIQRNNKRKQRRNDSSNTTKRIHR